MRAYVDRILSRAEWSRAGIETVQDQLVENLQYDLYIYLNAVIVASEAPTTNRSRQPNWPVHGSFTRITDGLRALVQTAYAFHGPPVIDD